MYRIRFHGRGGQGMKTASRILGKALFLEGFEVQDAPRYGAERRGAPIFSYVRADHVPINERGIITRPDLIVVADDSLLGIPEAAVLSGCNTSTVLFIYSQEEGSTWQHRLNLGCPVITFQLKADIHRRYLGAACVGGAAFLLGTVSSEALAEAIRQEIAPLNKEAVEGSLKAANHVYQNLSESGGLVREGEVVSAQDYQPPGWIALPVEGVGASAPAIHAGATSEKVQTGSWRTERPVIDKKLCNRCWWICSTFCPEGAIQVDDERQPQIDYDHCKGCMVCLAQCPTHAISTLPEGGHGP